MSASVNKVMLIGNLGRDPEVRYTPSGAAVCNISLATTRNWKSREGGERQEETEWHRVVFYDRLAEIAGEYLKKGRPVYVEGRLKTRKWQDKEGRDQYTTEIIAESMQLLGDREGGSGGRRPEPSDDENENENENEAAARQRNAGADGRQRAPTPTPAPSGDRMRRAPGAAASYGSAGGRAAEPQRSGFDDMDDDIPF